MFFFFFLNFCWTHAHLWGHWYPCFGLLVTSPMGFKARVGSALFALGGGVRNIHSLWFTSGATPLPVYNASIAASHLPHMRVSAEVGCRDLNRRLCRDVIRIIKHSHLFWAVWFFWMHKSSNRTYFHRYIFIEYNLKRKRVIKRESFVFKGKTLIWKLGQ